MTDAAEGQQGQPPQPDSKHIIKALQDELGAANSNRLYLMACISQMSEEYVQLQNQFNVEQAEWELARASLLKRLGEDEDGTDVDKDDSGGS